MAPKMNMDNKQPPEEGFVRFNHSLYHALLLTSLTSRQLKVVLLVIRLTLGCHQKWAKLIQAELQIVGITASHAGEVIDELLQKTILVQNEKTGEYRLNEKYFVLDDKRRIRLERLTHLIGDQLYKTSQSGNPVNPKMVTQDFPNGEHDSSQIGNSDPFQNWEDLISGKSKNTTPKDNDKDNIKHNVKESIAAIDSYKRIISKVDPHTFVPKTEAQKYALYAWENIEPDKPDSFNLYLWCAHRGLPPEIFDQFTNDILSHDNYDNPGAMFNKKAMDYLRQNDLL